MKKNSNAFRSAQVHNAMRILIIFCVVVVAAAAVLWASLPANRQALFGWMGIKKAEVTPKDGTTSDNNDAGINGPVAVNEALIVPPVTPDDHIWGNIGAPVQFIVYEDFQCPFCAQLYDTLEQAKAEFGTDLVVVYRHFPLSSHEAAIPAAIASECAGAQGKFWEMYRELFELNKKAILGVETIKAAGAKLQLDEGAYGDCLTKEQYKDKILAQKEEVKKLGVGGTPAGFLNGEYVAGAVPYEDFVHPDGTPAPGLKSLIKKKLAQ